jgi:NADH:ubiquinone oxidoreductase subunit 5 (subunit L)/multisubunit Na+/H+ antiporter MnhA subunit
MSTGHRHHRLVNIKNLLAGSCAAHPVRTFRRGWNPNVTLSSPLLLLGLGLMLVGLGFKVAAVPFHFWSADVFDGSRCRVVAFMGSGVKAAGFAALVRVFSIGFETYTTQWRPAIYALAVLSMVVGSALAIVQTNVKRTLAYSSISHAGFILMALASSSAEGDRAILFYLVTYTFMVAGSFGVVSIVARRGDGRTSLDDYKGLSKSNPGLAIVFTLFLLAQAGVPFTSGFVAKLYTIIAAIAADATWLAIIAMLSSVIAAFLYLRIIVSMYMSGDTEDGTVHTTLAKNRVPAGARPRAASLVVTLASGSCPARSRTSPPTALPPSSTSRRSRPPARRSPPCRVPVPPGPAPARPRGPRPPAPPRAAPAPPPATDPVRPATDPVRPATDPVRPATDHAGQRLIWAVGGRPRSRANGPDRPGMDGSGGG